MSTPVFQLFILRNNITASQLRNTLSKEEDDRLFQKEQASESAVNAFPILLCESRWADESHPFWGVVRFPDLAARIQHTRTLNEIGWLDRNDAFTLLGTADHEPEVVTISKPIYKVWVIKSNPAAAQAMAALSEEATKAMWAKHNAIYKETGSQIVLSCNSYWSNEAYPAFGVSAYPNIEANQKVMQTLTALGWQRYFDSFTVLGTSDR